MFDMNEKILNWKLTKRDGGYLLISYSPGEPAVTLDQVSLVLPGGVYTTFRTYFHTRCMRIQDHIQRLVDSSAVAYHQGELFDQPFRAALREIVRLSPYHESRIRVTLDLEKEPGCLYVSLEELHTPPASAYLNGVKTNTQVMHRESPKAKLTSFIPTAAAFRAQLPPGVNETLMVLEDGSILEGLSSNFFAGRGGSLVTAEEGVLPGITRGIVLDVARKCGFDIRLTQILLSELSGLDECFITSASRAVLPVIQIDHQLIGDGKPGPITRKVMTLFDEWILREAEEI